MKRLFFIEWNKIFYYKATRTFTILYFLMLVAIGLILAFIKPEIGGMKLNIAKMGTFNFPVVWENITYLVAIAKIFIAVIIITNVTAEFSNRTLKQNLIDGLSKKEFLTSKIMTNTVFALLSTIFVLIIVLSLGLSFSTSKEHFITGIEYIGAYFLKLSLFFSICLFLAVLLKRTAFAFLGLIVLWIIEVVFSTAEVAIKAFRGKGVMTITQNDFFFSNYLPLSTSSKLIDTPNFNVEGFVMGGSVFEFRPVEISFVIAGILYFMIFTFLSFWILKKRDL